MFHFQCEWVEGQETPVRSGFELGHMTFAGQQGICSSRGRTPDQAMMLGVAIVELLDGLNQFVSGGSSDYTFIGTDSSFSVRFRKTKGGRIAVQCGATLVDEVEAVSLCRAILAGAETFFRHSGKQLPAGDPVLADLTSAIEEFARAFS
jgi:hypothetical protein